LASGCSFFLSTGGCFEYSLDRALQMWLRQVRIFGRGDGQVPSQLLDGPQVDASHIRLRADELNFALGKSQLNLAEP
jgi:hypothetical protein